MAIRTGTHAPAVADVPEKMKEREVTDKDLKQAQEEKKVVTGKPSRQQIEAEEQAEEKKDQR